MNNSRFSNLVIFWTFFIIFLLFNTVSISKNIDLFKGMELYNKNCSSCHMMNLAGKPDWKTGVDEDGQRLPPPLNGTGHTWHHSPEQLFQIIRYGYKKFDPNYKGKMLGNEDLSEDDVWSILEYIKSMWPENIRTKYDSRFSE
jgi:mono/diheme cytochrome c family protein|tara:strand:+ start:634 stop:1062 length:429 start_codon:yes stop_codon:yes gene_type:complete